MFVIKRKIEMIDNLPIFITHAFVVTTLGTLILFIWTIKNSYSEKTQKHTISILICLSIWLVIQSILSLKNIYNLDTNSIPPKIVLFGIFPTILTVIYLFASQKGRNFIYSLPLKNLIYINIVRIPVEIVLFSLFLNKAIPELMTF